MGSLFRSFFLIYVKLAQIFSFNIYYYVIPSKHQTWMKCFKKKFIIPSGNFMNKLIALVYHPMPTIYFLKTNIWTCQNRCVSTCRQLRKCGENSRGTSLKTRVSEFRIDAESTNLAAKFLTLLNNFIIYFKFEQILPNGKPLLEM